MIKGNRYEKMGEWLLARGCVSEEQLDAAVETARSSRRRLGEALISHGFVRQADVVRCLSEQYMLPIADLQELVPEAKALAMLPGATALTYLFLPVAIDDHTLTAVIADPLDVNGTDMLARAVNRRVTLWIAPPTELHDAIVEHYKIVPVAVPDPPKRHRRKRHGSDDQSDKRELLDLLPVLEPALAVLELGN